MVCVFYVTGSALLPFRELMCSLSLPQRKIQHHYLLWTKSFIFSAKYIRTGNHGRESVILHFPQLFPALPSVYLHPLIYCLAPWPSIHYRHCWSLLQCCLPLTGGLQLGKGSEKREHKFLSSATLPQSGYSLFSPVSFLLPFPHCCLCQVHIQRCFEQNAKAARADYNCTWILL